MTDFTEPPEAPPAPPPPKPPFRARLRKFVVRLLVFVAVVAAVVGGVRRQVGRAGQQQLDALVVQLHAAEPGWRMGDIEADRRTRTPPPDRNGALVVMAAADKFPDNWQQSWLNDAAWRWQLPEPFIPAPEDVEKLKAAGPPMAEARALALKLRDLPHGHYPVEFPPDRFEPSCPHLGKPISVANLLEYDAAVAVLIDP